MILLNLKQSGHSGTVWFKYVSRRGVDWPQSHHTSAWGPWFAQAFPKSGTSCFKKKRAASAVSAGWRPPSLPWSSSGGSRTYRLPTYLIPTRSNKNTSWRIFYNLKSYLSFPSRRKICMRHCPVLRSESHVGPGLMDTSTLRLDSLCGSRDLHQPPPIRNTHPFLPSAAEKLQIRQCQ